jgi:GIY-YIG catalytic domain-containing protein
MEINRIKYLKYNSKKLLNSNQQSCQLTLEWKKTFNDGPGVYVIEIDNEVVYVGETSNLQERMNDLRNTKNHTVRRNLGNDLFKRHKGYFKATSKKSFVESIEKKLVNYMIKHLKIRTLPLDLGRKELEEYIMDTYGKPMYNIRATKRLNRNN